MVNSKNVCSPQFVGAQKEPANLFFIKVCGLWERLFSLFYFKIVKKLFRKV